jgi:hypothetical protein
MPDVYSIENYYVAASVLLRTYRDSIRLTNVAFDETVIVDHFEGASFGASTAHTGNNGLDSGRGARAYGPTSATSI